MFSTQYDGLVLERSSKLRAAKRCYISTRTVFHPRVQKTSFEDRHPRWWSSDTVPTSLQHSWLESNRCARVGDAKELYDLGYQNGMWGRDNLGGSDDYDEGYRQGCSDSEDCS